LADAVVIGAGPNGLVAANVLADAGWDVVVLEAQPTPGGAVRSSELTGQPGFVHDWFSAFYPLGVASPAMRALDLERHGLRWRRAPLVVAHPTRDGTSVAISQDIDETAASFERFAPGDGDRWRRLYARWEHVGGDVVDALLGGPFPPLRAAGRMGAKLNRDLLRFLRFGLLPARTLAQEEFRGDGAARMLAGNALHADFAPESAGSGIYAWVLCSLAQQHGWPVPEGGAGSLTAALVRRLEAAGGRVEPGARVESIAVRRGRAIGVRVDGGRDVAARRAVLADVAAPALFLGLLGSDHLPARMLDDLRRFEFDAGTVKVDWALDGPIPWSHPEARRAGTLHLGEGVDGLTVWAGELARKLVPSEPFMLAGQYSMTDPTRQPAGAETAWAYTHVPQRVAGDAGGDGITGAWDERETDAIAARMEAQIEALAPGFQSLVRARHVFTPRTFAESDDNLRGGALNGGTAQIHQQLVFRPTPGSGRPETPVRGLFLASASAHPGGGVHGACGANAARAALKWHAAKRTAVAVGAIGAAGLRLKR
jgi:phytoene dehydrogenase-like protein